MKSSLRDSLVCVFLLLFLGEGAQAREAMPTYAEWHTACAPLPTNRKLGGRLPPKDLLPLRSFGAFEPALDRFFSLATNGPLAAPTNWVGSAPRRETFLNVEKSWFVPPEIPFEPFVERLNLPPAARVFVQGDLHGDIRSLLAVLDRLNERKWLEGFSIVDPNFHMVFLGDFTDRGMYGVEVLYTLFRLKVANPDRVHFSRGNHEDVNLVARYGFLAEARGKYGPEFKAARLLRAYDFLPVALFLGTGKDFVQMCHGGLEPGFNPAPVLAAAGEQRFQLLGNLRQATFLKEHPAWLQGDEAAMDDARRYFRDFTPTAPTTPTVIGFMWNDFTVFSEEPAFANNPDRAFVYGQPAAAGLLRTMGGEARVHAVLRAHQHSGLINPIMRRLVAGNGLFRHWQEKSEAALAALPGRPNVSPSLDKAGLRPIPEGSVWTFNVVPDSVYGEGCGFTFATFGVLQLAPAFADWRIAVETVEIPGL